MEEEYVSNCCGIPIKRMEVFFEADKRTKRIEPSSTFFICVCDRYYKVKSETKDGRPRYGCGLPCDPEEVVEPEDKG